MLVPTIGRERKEENDVGIVVKLERRKVYLPLLQVVILLPIVMLLPIEVVIEAHQSKQRARLDWI